MYVPSSCVELRNSHKTCLHEISYLEFLLKFVTHSDSGYNCTKKTGTLHEDRSTHVSHRDRPLWHSSWANKPGGEEKTGHKTQQLRPCGQSPVSHRGGPGSISGQSLWNVLDQVAIRQGFSNAFGIPLLVSLCQCFSITLLRISEHTRIDNYHLEHA
jgi:hypothetical protein